MAADRGVDIITCSYGGTGGFPEDRDLAGRADLRQLCGEREEGIFVGLWVPSILALGAFAVSTLAATTRR